MLYHVSVALDFSEEHLIVGHIVTSSSISSSLTPESSTIVSSVTANSFTDYMNKTDQTSEVDSLLEESIKKYEPLKNKAIRNEECKTRPMSRVAVCSLNSKDATHNHPLEPLGSPVSGNPHAGNPQTSQRLEIVGENSEGELTSCLAGEKLSQTKESEADFLIQQRLPAAKDWSPSLGKRVTSHKDHFHKGLPNSPKKNPLNDSPHSHNE